MEVINMKKIWFSSIIIGTLLLVGCSETKERVMSLLTDSDIEQSVKVERTLAEDIEDVLETAVNQVEEYAPNFDEDIQPMEATNSILVNQPYAVDGDTLTGQVNKNELLAHGIEINDSMKVLGNQVSVKVRYLLIDTPESVDPDINEPQKYSKEAKNRNNELLLDGDVTISFDKGDRVDKYGRLLAYVYQSGHLIQETLVEEGYARVAYINKPNTNYLSVLEAAEERAHQDNLRIWSIDGYVTDFGFSD